MTLCTLFKVKNCMISSLLLIIRVLNLTHLPVFFSPKPLLPASLPGSHLMHIYSTWISLMDLLYALNCPETIGPFRSAWLGLPRPPWERVEPRAWKEEKTQERTKPVVLLFVGVFNIAIGALNMWCCIDGLEFRAVFHYNTGCLKMFACKSCILYRTFRIILLAQVKNL